MYTRAFARGGWKTNHLSFARIIITLLLLFKSSSSFPLLKVHREKWNAHPNPDDGGNRHPIH
jgi:hypothetical protein